MTSGFFILFVGWRALQLCPERQFMKCPVTGKKEKRKVAKPV